MRNVLISGIVLMAAGAVLNFVAPLAFGAVSVSGLQDPLMIQLLSVLLGVIQQAVLPLGAALIGAGILGLHLDRRLTANAAAERPHRVYLAPRDADTRR